MENSKIWASDKSSWSFPSRGVAREMKLRTRLLTASDWILQDGKPLENFKYGNIRTRCPFQIKTSRLDR